MRAARIFTGCAVALAATASACSSTNSGLAQSNSPTTNVGSTVPSCGSPASTTTSVPSSADVPSTAAGGNSSTTSGSTTASTLFVTGSVPPVTCATDLSQEPIPSAGSGTPPTVLTGQDLVVGTGAVAAAGDSVTVQYVGALYSGQLFDASWTDGNGPFSTKLVAGQTVPGFMDAIIGMKVGGRREIVIPPDMGYGAQGSGPIPANATLVFVIDLLRVKAS